MSDLFTFGAQKQPKHKSTIIDSSYTAKDIEVLEGLEPVRKRPGMYIGGTDVTAMHHLVTEVIDNAMDEAVAGFANLITVTLHSDNNITVSDNGRGIPVDDHHKFPGKSALEVIMTTLHSGGKFTNNAYKTAGGLHGVGISVVNALSEHLEVTVYKENKAFSQKYSRGMALESLQVRDIQKKQSGTSITFRPDRELFGADTNFISEKLYDIARSKAYLYRGVKISWRCCEDLITHDHVPSDAMIYFPNGLTDYLNSKIDISSTIGGALFNGNGNSAIHDAKIEWAISWSTNTKFIISYCNTIHTQFGGPHEQGVRGALLNGLRSYGASIGNKKAQLITIDDVLEQACIIISVFIKDPIFQGQTKDKLVSAGGINKIIENIIKDHFDHWLSANKNCATMLLEHIINIAEFRINRKNDKNILRKNVTQKLRLPGKLADCISDSRIGTELFIVEGDSAGGSAKQARDRNTQAILPLRGKILNIATSTIDKIAHNQEIQDLELALACGVLQNFQLDKLRYEKVIIMTDADVDGAHIATLLMTFFYIRMPQLITTGHLYIAQPPLYRLTQGNKTYYAANDATKDSLIQKLSKQSKYKIDTGRFKGLGEMTPTQLKETTMNPKNRTMFQVNIRDATLTARLVQDLMGKNPEKRFAFIQSEVLMRMTSIMNDLDI